MKRSKQAVIHGLMALAAYVAVVILSSAASDYSYYLQNQNLGQ